VATSLPGFRGMPAQDAAILAMKAGQSHPDHGRDTNDRHAGYQPMPVYASPVPPAEALPSFTASLGRDHTPRTHAAPTTAWAQLDAGTAQELSNQIHGVRFTYPHTSQYVASNQMPHQLIHDIDPGSSHLAGGVPDQLRFNGPRGAQDITQGGGQPNGYGFSSAHVVRWRSDGWVPIWHVGSAERPVRVDPMQGRNRSTNVDSWVGQGGTVTAMANSTPYTGAPTVYQTPANPHSATSYGPTAGFAW
jgi:hypothetical protein